MANVKKGSIPGHRLIIEATYKKSPEGGCECGEDLGSTPTVQSLAMRWRMHVETIEHLAKAQAAVEREFAARAERDAAILVLLNAGMTTRKIAAALGEDGDGKLLVSESSVRRVAGTKAP